MKAICVYCGAKAGSAPLYAQAAEKFAYALVKSQLSLVYGGGKVGLMGVLADAVLASNGKVVGVIPHALVQKELAHPHLSTLHITTDMHTRKAKMAELSHAFVALPGGMGTYDELFEILTWKQLGFHHKPIGILNVNGFYDGLLHFLKHAVAEGFIAAEWVDSIVVENTVPTLFTRLLPLLNH